MLSPGAPIQAQEGALGRVCHRLVKQLTSRTAYPSQVEKLPVQCAYIGDGI